jgi:hypothetical protein
LLILAFHGIYSNPSDQAWLMMGGHNRRDAFDENQANGGPFCISFHKAKGDAWEYSCQGDDAAHIEGFIHWALADNPSLDPKAVNLHGFSSGAIQTLHMMDTSCPIERLVSGAAPYAGGFVSSPPTTKAAFLIAHGTHDNVVQYGEGWSESGTAVPTCGINDPGFFNGFQEFQDTWIDLFGESIVAGVARYRGYEGEIFGPPPAPSGSIDLIDETTRRNGKTCEAVLADCVDQYGRPSPFNAGFSCASLPDAETDVIDYPVNPGSKPVRLLRINIHNHDYPNRRRSRGGPSEFFFTIRKFFNDYRGERPPKAEQTVRDMGARVCADPDFLSEGPSVAYRRKIWDSHEAGGVTPQICSERCRADEECVESFYIDYMPYYFDKVCHLHSRFLPCTSTKSHWGTARHFVTEAATPQPTPRPTPFPTSHPTPPPTPLPTPFPTIKNTPLPPPASGFCPSGWDLLGGNFAGYSCLDGLGDSNTGMTEEDCLSVGGEWVPYDCATADSYWNSVGGTAWEYAVYFEDAWSSQCCSSPPPASFCPGDTSLAEQSPAGYSCLDGLGDSNSGMAEEDCLAVGGEWVPYNCADADAYWMSVGGAAWQYAYIFEDAWSSQCCSAAPSTGFCPEDSSLIGENPAGYSCLDGLGDSNSGMTQQDCLGVGGEWAPYDCWTADWYWESVGGSAWQYAYIFEPAWSSQCCS